LDWSTFTHWWRSVVRPQVRRAARKRHKRWPVTRPMVESLEPRKLLSSSLIDAPQPELQDANLNFNTNVVQSYGGASQDVSGSAVVQNGGSTVQITGNAWKRVALNYNVTENTVIEFDFSSSNEGEVHGIGFDTDNVLSSETFFQVHGSQNWGNTDFNNYNGNGSTKHYKIDVGDYFTGSFNFITFGNDHDVANPDGQGVFSNVTIYEDTGGVNIPPSPAGVTPIDLDDFTVQSYGGSSQDVTGTFDVLDAGSTLHLTGNTWKNIAFNYNVTANTILEFDFKTDAPGEVHGIGFDSDPGLTSASFFQTAGSQNWGITDFKNNSGNGDWQHFKISVGDFFTGQMTNLTFGNDHDVANPNASAFYANITVYEEGGSGGGTNIDPPDAPNGVTPLNFNSNPVTVYDNSQNIAGTAQVQNGGQTLHINGNNWRKISLPYNITANTVLEFDFRSDSEGEVHGVGFDTDNFLSSEKFFQVFGTQNFGHGAHNNYNGNGQWKHYKINVGDFFTGNVSNLIFGNDDDTNNPDARSWFANVAVYEEGGNNGGGGSNIDPPAAPNGVTPLNFNSNPVTVYDNSQNVAGTSRVQNGGQTLHINGNNWRKISLPYNITANTVLEFDFRSDSQGEVHGIGFDTDNFLSGEMFFRTFGTQGFGHDAFDTYNGNGQWKHYKINVGDFFTGNVSNLIFGNDHDVNNPDATSWYANVAVYEEGGNSGGGGGNTNIDPPAAPNGVTPLDFNSNSVTVYDNSQNVTGTSQVQNNGQTLHINGNNWRKISLPYNITANTVLEFDFRSDAEGEVHGVGFDTDNSLSGDKLFRVFGTQGFGIGDFDNYNGDGQWKHYKINVGDFFTGNVSNLIFANDHDTNNPDATSWYANVAVYEEGGNSEPAPGTAPPAPAPVPGHEPFLFDLQSVQSYGGSSQDVIGTKTVADNGRTLHIAGNTWKRVAHNYNVTANTVLEFDFYSDFEGEVHGIGFDNDTNLSNDFFFQVFGTQDWGNTNFKNYGPSEGSWKHYKIKVGDFFTGAMTQLIFAMDNDVAIPLSESYFANVTLYEEGGGSGGGSGNPAPGPGGLDVIDFGNENVQPYDFPFQDVTGIFDIQDGDRTIHLTGNTWKKISEPYTVTSQTVLEFDFRTDALGEVHGIGFDTDESLSPESFFQVAGSQNFGFTDFKNYAGTDWQHYKINVGEFFTGSFQTLIFGNDHDVVNPTAKGWFANVALYEDGSINPPPPPPADGPPAPPSGLTTLDLDTFSYSNYTTQDMNGNSQVKDGGQTLHLTGNTWKKIDLPYDVNSRTVIEFDFKATKEGEIHGIGFDTDNSLSSDRIFQLTGTQTWGIQDFNTYDIGDGWVHYRIEIGSFYQGSMNHLVFANDQDAGNPDADAMFANVAVYDEPLPPHTPSYNEVSGWGLVDASRAVSRALGNTTDPLPDAPYHGNSNHWGVNAVNAPEAWQAGHTGEGIVVAVIDTGVNYNHSDLNDNIWSNTDEIAGDGIDNDGNGFIDDIRGWDFVDDDNNPLDSNGHGTLVAGVIAAENNGNGATGVAPDAQIMPIRVIDGVGAGDFFTVLDGIDYAIRNGADVINLSVAFETGHPDLQAKIQQAQAAGVVVVSAAGNDAAESPIFPAAYSNIAGIGVGGSTQGGGIASFSNRAGTGVKDFVLAPGVSVYTTNGGGGFSSVSATSFSTPYVSGVAALVLSANPFLPASTVEFYISQSASQSALNL